MMGQLADILPWLIWPVVLCFSVTLDALYSGLETGIYRLNRIRLDLHAEDKYYPAVLLQKMLHKPRYLLATSLIGTNVCRYISTFAITSMFLMGGAGGNADLYTVALTTPVLFILGDAVPKNCFQRLGERPVYALARFIRVSDILFRYTGLSPLVIALSTVVMKLTGSRKAASDPHWQDPIGTAMAEGHASGAITHFQSVMADRVMRIGQVKVRDVMVPMDRVIKADAEIARDELIDLYRRHDVSRIPLMQSDRSVAGLLDVYDALTSPDGATPREMMTEPTLLPSQTSVSDALLRMQATHAVMGVVADEHDRHVGIVTMKDLVEEIVGELEAW